MSKEVKVKTIQDFIEDSKKTIGWPCAHPGFGLKAILQCQVPHKGPIREDELQDWSLAMGDDNPLYLDPQYGRRSRWGTMIAHPTIVADFRYPVGRGASGYGNYASVGLVAGFGWEYNDVIRVGDEFETSFMMNEVIPKKGATGTLCFTYSRVGYWNQFHELVSTGRGGNCMIGRDTTATNEGYRGEMVYERGVYHYSKEECDKIVKDIMAEERRGANTRYWEDINVGDKLVPTVKGPLSTTELMGWDAVHVKLGIQKQQILEERGNFEIAIRRVVKGEEEDPLNTMTGFPYQPANRHYDWDACKSSGMPAPFDVGCFRACATSHLLSNFMGDDGFIRRFDLQLRKPMFYGDTVWYLAEVVKKYKDKVGDVEYSAVDIKITGTNQLGEVCAPATATVYLPSRGEPIKLPVPHNDNYEAYKEYLSKSKELAEQRDKTGNPYWPIEQ